MNNYLFYVLNKNLLTWFKINATGNPINQKVTFPKYFPNFPFLTFNNSNMIPTVKNVILVWNKFVNKLSPLI